MDTLKHLVDVFLHLDVHLNDWAQWMGAWLYAALFAVVFCETGLVVTPFLPGDSLLFAVGALAATEGSPIHVFAISVVLATAGILGDAANYAIGKWIGPKVFARENSRLLNRQHLLKAQAFYEKYGGKTIIFARFVPIVRTFAPFVAGIGRMGYGRFALFNIAGGIGWVALLVGVGYAFGNVPFVKQNFHWVVVGIVVVSILPAIIEWWRMSRASKGATPNPAG